MTEIQRVWGNDENIDVEEGINRGKYSACALKMRRILPTNILDLCCGKGYVLEGFKREFTAASCYGIDMVRYDEWTTWEQILFIQTTFQNFINNCTFIFDVILMLESWRRWDMLADINLVWRTDLVAWLKIHTKYFICSESLFEFEHDNWEQIGIDYLENKGPHALYMVKL